MILLLSKAVWRRECSWILHNYSIRDFALDYSSGRLLGRRIQDPPGILKTMIHDGKRSFFGGSTYIHIKIHLRIGVLCCYVVYVLFQGCLLTEKPTDSDEGLTIANVFVVGSLKVCDIRNRFSI